MDRDNDTWVADLRRDDSARDSALSDLRTALLRNLRKGLSQHGHADDSFLEDAAQDSLIRILDRLDQFAGRSRFITWATSIAIHMAMTELRRRRWKDVSLDQVMQDAEFLPRQAVDGNLGPDARLVRTALLEKMHEVIQTELTDRQRTVLLAELKGMPQEEIVRHLGSNRNAVYKLSHDARKRLKRGLESAGYQAEDIHAAFAG
jgi:RNA polymerase sigma-70 factor (ECF subfamily)